MKYLRFIVRLLLSLLHAGPVAVLLVTLIGRPGADGFSKFQAGVIAWLVRVQLRILGVRIRVTGTSCPDAPLLIANHVSWLDILVLDAVRTSRFLSKVEVRKWFVVGYLSSRFGTIFIRRGEGAGEAIRLIAEGLRHGTSTAVFPEGTTSNGDTVRRLHPRLFAAAIEAGTWIQPVVLYYPATDGKGVNPLAPFVRDQSLFSHALGLLYNRHLDVWVHFTEPVASEGQSRDALAQRCHQKMLAAHDNFAQQSP